MGHTRFVILSQPRTGSTLVCSLLSSIPGVRALVEPVNPLGHYHHMQPIIGSRCLLPQDMIQSDISGAMDMLLAEDPPPIKWVLSRKVADVAAGFKIMAHQIQALNQEGIFWRYLSRNNIKVILVFRYNILQQYISDIITSITNQPACWDGNAKTAKVEIHLESLEANFARIIREKQYLLDMVAKWDLDHKRLKYEDFKDDMTTVGNILPWLIGKHAKLQTRLIKQNPNNVKDRVTNYAELAEVVAKLGFKNLLDP